MRKMKSMSERLADKSRKARVAERRRWLNAILPPPVLKPLPLTKGTVMTSEAMAMYYSREPLGTEYTQHILKWVREQERDVRVGAFLQVAGEWDVWEHIGPTEWKALTPHA